MTSPMPFDPGFTATNFAGFSLSVDLVGGDKNLGANWNSLQMGDTTLNAQDAAVGGYQLSRFQLVGQLAYGNVCLLYTSPSPRDRTRSRMPSSA